MCRGCNHAETDHLEGGACRVEGCTCRRLRSDER